MVHLSPARTFWCFGLLFPLYLVWLRAIGLYFMNRNGKNPFLFNILSAFLIVYSVLVLAIPIVFRNFGEQISQQVLISNLLLFFMVWLGCNALVSKQMIDYREKDNEYFYGFARTMRHYIIRFFNLFYYPFSIYFMQEEIQQGLKHEQHET